MVFGLLGLWAAGYLLFRRARAWLLAYVWGSVGACLFGIYFLRGTLVEQAIERGTALAAHNVCEVLGIPTRVFFDAPRTLLVLIVFQRLGWTSIEIDIECSGMLELMVFTSLVLFFQGFRWDYKARALPLGLVLTFLINIIRVVIIVTFIHFGGKNAIYISHTVIGRAIFFIMVIGLYWYVFTRPTVRMIKRNIVGK